MLDKILKLVTFGLLLSSDTKYVTAQPSNSVNCDNQPIPFQPCNDFELSAGAATTSTQYWFLGELHYKRNQTNDCIDALTMNVGKHRVYLENYPAGKMYACDDVGIRSKKGRECIGADDVEARKNVSELVIKQEAISKRVRNLKDIYLKEKLTDEKMDQFLERLITPENLAQHNHFADSIIKVQKFFSEMRSRGLTYTEIFQSEDIAYFSSVKLIGKQIEEIRNNNLVRNKSLFFTLKNAPDKQFTVVVGGRHHMVNTSDDDLGAAEYVRDELEKTTHQNPYAILAAIQTPMEVELEKKQSKNKR